MRFPSWQANCAVKNTTNGVNYLEDSSKNPQVEEPRSKMPIAGIKDLLRPASAVGLPPEFVPTIPSVPGSSGVVMSYILPDNHTGVVSNPSASPLSSSNQSLQIFVCSFYPDIRNFEQFQYDVEAA